MYDPITESVLRRGRWSKVTAQHLADVQQVMSHTKIKHKPAIDAAMDSMVIIANTLELTKRAEHFYVDTHFADLVQFAAETVPDDVVFDESELLATVGWAEIEDGLLWQIPLDRKAHDPEFDAQRKSIMTWWKLPDERGRDMYQFTLHSLEPRWGEDMADPQKLPFDGIDIYDGDRISDVRARMKQVEDEYGWVHGDWARVCFTLMHLMAQKLAVSSSRKPQGYAATTARVKLGIEEVRVISLRRMEYERKEAADSGREYQCQWHVRGHWRQQFYPSLDETRPIFIDAYIKGPEDKPLKPLTHPIFVARR